MKHSRECIFSLSRYIFKVITLQEILTKKTLQEIDNETLENAFSLCHRGIL